MRESCAVRPKPRRGPRIGVGRTAGEGAWAGASAGGAGQALWGEVSEWEGAAQAAGEDIPRAVTNSLC